MGKLTIQQPVRRASTFLAKTGFLFARKLICFLSNLPDAKRLTQNCVLKFPKPSRGMLGQSMSVVSRTVAPG
jgi:hypothetical protein